MADLEKSGNTPPTTFDPFAELNRLREHLWALPPRWGTDWFGPLTDGFVPVADIEETDDAWTIEAELPGVAKKDIEIRNNTVVITGERKQKERKGILRQKKRVTGNFRYEVTLPGDLDETNIDAKLDHGELTVRVPKSAADQPRKISVN